MGKYWDKENKAVYIEILRVLKVLFGKDLNQIKPLMVILPNRIKLNCNIWHLP